jgi:hypothetical protein
MNRSVLAVAGFVVLAWSRLAMAQASSISTPCPVNYQCAFTAAETMALGTPSKAGVPGQPDAFVGYMSFDGSSNVTVQGLQNINGTVTSLGPSGTCTAGSNGSPGTVALSDGSVIAFVAPGRGGNLSTTTPAELDFILSKDANSSGTMTNSVRVGVCRTL